MARPCAHERAECWRPVADFAGYEVSCQGHVRSWRSYAGGRGLPPDKPHALALREKDNGYLEVTFEDNGQRHKRYVHREVLLAFKGKPLYPAIYAAHLDATRSHNRLRNLEWVSKRENEHRGTEPREQEAPF